MFSNDNMNESLRLLCLVLYRIELVLMKQYRLHYQYNLIEELYAMKWMNEWMFTEDSSNSFQVIWVATFHSIFPCIFTETIKPSFVKTIIWWTCLEWGFVRSNGGNTRISSTRINES